MFACKGCGGPLTFDVATQRLQCGYCKNSFDPYEIEDSGNAEESSSYDVTIFTCPQCGAEMGATETSAAEFCSFCGAPTVLQSRLSRMKRPQYIIPFRKTREEACASLKKYLGRAPFVPAGFKMSEVEKIRGIYMPCWNYHVTQQGEVKLSMHKDKENTRYFYRAGAQIDAEYRGIPHDASEAFSDYISEMLEPYNYKERKPFVPSFLAGFFSDVQDVDASRYERDACKFAAENTLKEFMSKVPLEGESFEIPKERELSEMFHTRLEETECTLIPVWFLSYRRGNRVAYAAVNGETGKVVSDLPLSIGRIWTYALLLAVPIFILLNMMMSLRAESIPIPVNTMSGLVTILNIALLLKIRKHEKDVSWIHADAAASGKVKSRTKVDVKSHIKTLGCVMAVLILGALPLCFLLILGVSLGFAAVVFAVCFFALFAAPVVPLIALICFRKEKRPMVLLGFLLLSLAAFFTSGVFFAESVSDVPYYAAALADLTAVLVTVSGIWTSMNLLTTRPLPQFAKRGGDEHEK